jgi:hypothetical protein
VGKFVNGRFRADRHKPGWDADEPSPQREWLRLCARYARLGTFLWGNQRTRQISVRSTNGNVMLWK